jgi:hypothetical protein
VNIAILKIIPAIIIDQNSQFNLEYEGKLNDLEAIIGAIKNAIKGITKNNLKIVK